MATRDNLIEVKDLKKHYHGNAIKALDGVSTEIHSGDVCVVIGPSGSGKSTFLRSLNLLEEPTGGSIIFEGIDIIKKKYKDENGKTVRLDIDKLRQKMGMVFQHFNLFPHLTVLENITLAPVSLKIMPAEEAKEKARKLLRKVGLEDKQNTFPRHLSGGQKQRVAIVRALIMNPKVLLFDEPTSALDPEMVGEVVSVMADIAKEGMTMIFVTHEMNFVKNLASRVLFMDGGSIAFDGKPEEMFENCKNERVNKFLNKLA